MAAVLAAAAAAYRPIHVCRVTAVSAVALPGPRRQTDVLTKHTELLGKHSDLTRDADALRVQLSDAEMAQISALDVAPDDPTKNMCLY